MTLPIVRLDSVADVRLGRQRSPKNHTGTHMRPYVRAANVGWGGLLLDDVKSMNFTDREMALYRLVPGDLLLSEASGSPREVGKAAIWNGEIDGCAFQNTLIRVRPRGPEPRYLLHYFRHQAESGRFAAQSRGVGIHHLGREILATWAVPLPPIEEQRRIAEVLDRADALRAKRREALAHLDDLTQSIFDAMFGDPLRDHGRWPRTSMGELLTSGLRNGLSPSTTGTVVGRVLTLSAVTGKAFREDSLKEAMFDHEPAADQRVRRNDLLICRGNGNRSLVGRGFFPTHDMVAVAYPDTMMAAPIAASMVSREYLEHIWNSNATRVQIESLARTTNGTFKVNQSMVESVSLPIPDRELQSTFSGRIGEIGQMRACYHDSLVELDALFGSLQQRAFSGQL